MPASRETIGSDEMRPGRSGPDTGTNEGGQGAEFSEPVDDEAVEPVSDEDLAAFTKAHGGGTNPPS